MSVRDSDRFQGVHDPAARIEELERKLARRSVALDQAYEEFQSLIFTISHDFKAPLRAILSSNMILREDFPDALGQEGLTELQRQDANIRKLNGLLEELLKVSRLSRLNFAPQPLDLGKVAQEAALELGPEAAVALDAQPGVQVIADPQLPKLALQQLFDNSLKFAEPSRPVKIQVGAEGQRCFVRDNGAGFDPSRAEKLFLPFERLHGPEYPGAGIGLAMFKRIIDRHKGLVGLDSKPGEGTTIWFELDE